MLLFISPCDVYHANAIASVTANIITCALVATTEFTRRILKGMKESEVKGMHLHFVDGKMKRRRMNYCWP